jgi:hypothetical protein
VRHSRARGITLFFALAILIPSLYGFGTKFREFVLLWQGDVDGVFAISPILNYLLASTGFLFLFCWATMQGMFRDIEQPKLDMLDREHLLDLAEADEPGADRWIRDIRNRGVAVDWAWFRRR